MGEDYKDLIAAVEQAVVRLYLKANSRSHLEKEPPRRKVLSAIFYMRSALQGLYLTWHNLKHDWG